MTIYSKKLKQFLILVAIAGLCIPVGAAYAWRNVISPDDQVIGVPDDGEWPGGETPQHAIDGNIHTKFLYWGGLNPGDEFGIRVTIQEPAVVNELSLVTGNDGEDRDPTYFRLYGSNSSISGPWDLIAEGPIVDFENADYPRRTRNETPILFENDTEYLHYEIVFPERAGADWGQIALIELIERGPVHVQAQDAVALPGQDASFVIEAEGANVLTYQWYKVAPDEDIAIDGATDAELVITAVDINDEGTYYCRVTDTATQQSWNSRGANLAIGRLMAHWTMDEADYDGTYYLDVSTEDPLAYNAEVNETPVFTEGMVGDAVDIVDLRGSAHAGHWDPMEYSNQMTLSAWVNWREIDIWQKILAKRSGWGPEHSRWQWYIDRGTTNLRLESPGVQLMTAYDVMHDDGQWQHVAVTFDGNMATIYVDGEIRAQQEPFRFGFGYDADFMIAAAQPWQEPFNGLLDDIKVYNYALSTVDIAEIYHSDSGRNPCINRPSLDITGDCKVGLADFAQIAVWWLHDGLYVD